MYKGIIVLIILLMSSCKLKNDRTNLISKITEVKSDSNRSIMTSKSKTDSMIKSQESIKVLGTLEKSIDTTKVKEIENLGCTKWVIKSKEIEKSFSKMREVSGSEWNSYCYHFPCSYKGTAIYNGEKFDLYVNSASYIILEKDFKKLYFILREENSNFLQACNCCE